MAAPVEVPIPVARFIATHVQTLEQLEVLLLMMHSPDRWWDAHAIAGAVGILEDTARRILDRLAARNLLAIRITGDVRYQFQPGESSLAEAARLTADTYRTNRLGVLQLVTEARRRSLRAFADAFRIRDDDDR
jgi:hypothetical protein